MSQTQQYDPNAVRPLKPWNSSNFGNGSYRPYAMQNANHQHQRGYNQSTQNYFIPRPPHQTQQQQHQFVSISAQLAQHGPGGGLAYMAEYQHYPGFNGRMVYQPSLVPVFFQELPPHSAHMDFQTHLQHPNQNMMCGGECDYDNQRNNFYAAAQGHTVGGALLLDSLDQSNMEIGSLNSKPVTTAVVAAATNPVAAQLPTTTMVADPKAAAFPKTAQNSPPLCQPIFATYFPVPTASSGTAPACASATTANPVPWSKRERRTLIIVNPSTNQPIEITSTPFDINANFSEEPKVVDSVQSTTSYIILADPARNHELRYIRPDRAVGKEPISPKILEEIRSSLFPAFEPDAEVKKEADTNNMINSGNKFALTSILSEEEPSRPINRSIQPQKLPEIMVDSCKRMEPPSFDADSGMSSPSSGLIEDQGPTSDGSSSPGSDLVPRNITCNEENSDDETRQRLQYSREILHQFARALEKDPNDNFNWSLLMSKNIAIIDKKPRPIRYSCLNGREHSLSPVLKIDLPETDIYVRAKDAYKIRHLQKNDLSEDEKVLLAVRTLLNKLAPENLKKLTEQLLGMTFFENPERLSNTVDLIFLKALDEPNYAQTYSKLCRSVLHTEVNEVSNANGSVEVPSLKFRAVLLQRAQQYFEQTHRETVEAATENSGIDADERNAKAKRRYIASIRFISELYKEDMLTDRVILSCYQRLLPQKQDYGDLDEEKLECLVNLLMTTGKFVMRTSAKAVESFFSSLENIIVSGKTSSRLRCLMQDAVDLKNNNFVGRTITAASIVQPKTMQEIRDEEHKKELQQRKADQNARLDYRYTRPQMSSGRLGGGGAIKPHAAEQVIQQESGSNIRNLGSVQPATRSNITTKSVSVKGASKFFKAMDANRVDQISLSPSVNGGSKWGAGSGVQNRSSSQARQQRMSLQANRSVSSSRESSSNRPDSAPVTHRHSSTQTLVSLTVSESSSSLSKSTISNTARSSVNLHITEEELQHIIKRMQAIINTEDTEVMDVIGEGASAIHQMSNAQREVVIKELVNTFFESRRPEERRKLATLMHGLTKDGCFSQDVFITSLGEIVGNTEDMALDIPSMHDYLIELIGPLLIETDGKGWLTLDSFEQITRLTNANHRYAYEKTFRKWLHIMSFHLHPGKHTLLLRRESEWSRFLTSAKL